MYKQTLVDPERRELRFWSLATCQRSLAGESIFGARSERTYQRPGPVLVLFSVLGSAPQMIEMGPTGPSC